MYFFLFRSLKLVLLGYILLPLLAVAQTVHGSLDFASDTFAVGKELILRLTLTHPDTIPVFFPTKNQNFGAFEFLREELIPTQTYGNTSTDVVLYHLQCFEVDKIQHLYMSYRYLQNGDTLTEQVSSDTLYLNERIAQKDSLSKLSYRASRGILSIEDPINFYWVLVATIISIFAFVFVILLLRKPFLRYFHRQIVKREWNGIRRQLQKLQTQSHKQSFYLDELNKIWKEIFGKAYNVQLRSLTTSELVPILENDETFSDYQNQVLIATAKASDKVIYAGQQLSSTEINSINEGIKTIIDDYYKNKIQKI